MLDTEEEEYDNSTDFCDGFDSGSSSSGGTLRSEQKLEVPCTISAPSSITFKHKHCDLSPLIGTKHQKGSTLLAYNKPAPTRSQPHPQPTPCSSPPFFSSSHRLWPPLLPQWHNAPPNSPCASRAQMQSPSSQSARLCWPPALHLEP